MEEGAQHNAGAVEEAARAPVHEKEDHTFKILLIGDSGVGKSSLLQRFVYDTFLDTQPTTVGVDFAVKMVNIYQKKIKLMIWDTAGQEKFRTLTSTFYRGAKGVILVYDVTRPQTLKSLEDYWLQELDSHASSVEAVKLVVGNKVDMDDRQVTWAEGMDFSKACGCLFVETSAKAGVAVATAFEELVLKILESPALMAPEEDGGQPALQLGRSSSGVAGASTCAC